MYKEDLALNNLQWLICHKTQPNKTKQNLYICSAIYFQCWLVIELRNLQDFGKNRKIENLEKEI